MGVPQNIEAIEAAAALLAAHVKAAWPHGHSAIHINNKGSCTVYVHRYGQCEIGSAPTVAEAVERCLKAAEMSWPSEEAARAAKIEKLRAELAAAEAEMVPA